MSTELTNVASNFGGEQSALVKLFASVAENCGELAKRTINASALGLDLLGEHKQASSMRHSDDMITGTGVS